MQSVLIDIEFVFVHKGNDFITKKLFPVKKTDHRRCVAISM